jgi:hypothetical protein
MFKKACSGSQLNQIIILSKYLSQILFGIAAGYTLDGRDSIPGRGKRFFSTPQRADRLWGPLSLET